jgi:hypothetical protein
MRFLIVTFTCGALAQLAAPAAHAQTSVTPLDFAVVGPTPAGWSFTPTLDYAFMWDSNVLIENQVSDPIGEQLHVIKPRGSAHFDGRRGKFAAHYSGAFVQHPTFSSLNSYDQRLGLNATRMATRRVSLFADYGAAAVPTTELVELAGVPFARIGTRRQDLRAGTTAHLTRTTELTAAYRFEWVDFDQDPNEITYLNGGYSHGGHAGLRHRITERVALIADYDLQRAAMANGSEFSLQNSSGGAEYQLSEHVRVFGSAGVSYLAGVDGRPAQVGPAVRVGVSRTVEMTQVGVTYLRSYVPSYGFGGTSDNEELTTHVYMPLARRFFTRGGFSVRRNEPLAAEDLTLNSLWFHGSVGYVLSDWARVEAFSAGSRQDIDRPGGRVNRYTFGVQITATTTARIR